MFATEQACFTLNCYTDTEYCEYNTFSETFTALLRFNIILFILHIWHRDNSFKLYTIALYYIARIVHTHKDTTQKYLPIDCAPSTGILGGFVSLYASSTLAIFICGRIPHVK